MKIMSKKVTVYSFMLAAALCFSYIEAILPFDFIAPGVKPGLANCVVLLFIFTEHKKAAFFINICRVLLSCLLFSGALSLAYALCGAIISFIIMLFAIKIKVFGTVGISILGAVAHNTAQCIVARFIFDNGGIFYYLPILILCGVVCGALTGICGEMLLKNKNIQKFLKV